MFLFLNTFLRLQRLSLAAFEILRVTFLYLDFQNTIFLQLNLVLSFNSSITDMKATRILLFDIIFSILRDNFFAISFFNFVFFVRVSVRLCLLFSLTTDISQSKFCGLVIYRVCVWEAFSCLVWAKSLLPIVTQWILSFVHYLKRYSLSLTECRKSMFFKPV